MKIILHADDFGYDEDTCNATINAFERGLLRSASIMATCPSATKAIEYAREHPQYSFGVHLTFVDSLKSAMALNNNNIYIYIYKNRDLTDENGHFYDSGTIRKKSLRLKIDTKEIVQEIISQIDIVESQGVSISHIDSHGHLHKFPSFLLALEQLRKIRPNLKIRRVQNLFLTAPSIFSPTHIANNIFDWIIKQRYKTTDLFYMPANNFDTKWSRQILNMIKTYPSDKVLEIGVHPGMVEQWRKNELNDLTEFNELLRQEEQHQLITWNEV